MINIRLVPLQEGEPDEDGNDAPDDMDGMFRFQKDMR